MGLVIMGHTYCWREEQTDGSMGLWCDAHIPPLAELVRRMHAWAKGCRGTRRARHQKTGWPFHRSFARSICL